MDENRTLRDSAELLEFREKRRIRDFRGFRGIVENRQPKIVYLRYRCLQCL